MKFNMGIGSRRNPTVAARIFDPSSCVQIIHQHPTTAPMDDIPTRLRIPHLEGHALYLGLFKEVSNAALLRQQLVQGNTDFEYAFLDATSVNGSGHG